jgi:hypothetical protein
MSLPQEEPRNEMPGYERFMKNQYLQNKRKEGERTHIYTGTPPGIDRDGRSVVSPSHTYGDRVANGMNKYGSGYSPASPASPMSPIEDGRRYEPIEEIGVGPNGSSKPIEDGDRRDDPENRSYPQKGGGQYAAGNRPSQTPARGGQGYVPRKSSYKSRSNSKQRMAGEVFN